MTIDKETIKNQFKSILPQRWFGYGDTPVLDAIIQGFSQIAYELYQKSNYVKLQERLQTATDINLDLISKDYFGNKLPRKKNESDDLYRKIISAHLLQEKATLNGMKKALTLLTGVEPIIFEPNIPDTGGFYLDVPEAGALDVTGVLSEDMPYQCFITVFVPDVGGMVGFGGLDTDAYALDVPDGVANLYLGEYSLIGNTVTDQDIYNLINDVKLEGTICWVSIIRVSSS